MALYGYTMAADASGDDFPVDRIEYSPGNFRLWPGVKFQLGVEGSEDGFVGASNPLPSRFYDGSGNPAAVLNAVPSSSDYGVVTRPVFSGITAADAAIAANPLTVGGRASTAVPTAVSADGDVVNAWMTRVGALNTTARDVSGNATDVDQSSHLTEPADWSSHKRLVTASAARPVGVLIDNSGNSSKSYVQFFDAAATASVTLGTTKPKFPVVVPAGGYTWVSLPKRQAFASGIVLGQTTTPTGSTGPSTGLTVVVFYY